MQNLESRTYTWQSWTGENMWNLFLRMEYAKRNRNALHVIIIECFELNRIFSLFLCFFYFCLSVVCSFAFQFHFMLLQIFGHFFFRFPSLFGRWDERVFCTKPKPLYYSYAFHLLFASLFMIVFTVVVLYFIIVRFFVVFALQVFCIICR